MQDYSGLHWMTAGLFLAAGAEAAFGERRGDYRPSEAVRWAPFVAAPLAGAAQAARALAPSASTRNAAKIAGAAAIGVGVAGLVNSVVAARRQHHYDADAEPALADKIPSLAPLAFGAVGLLALLLDREEEWEEIEEKKVRRTKTAAPRSRRGRVKAIRIRV
jgi:uncharacterized membrane protein